MDSNSCIDKVVELYFDGYSIEQALRLTKNEQKQEKLKEISEFWENKAKKEPVKEAREWRYQQPRMI